MKQHEQLARGIYAAFIAHQLGIGIAHAYKAYASTAELGPFWYEAAELVEIGALSGVDAALRRMEGARSAVQ